MGVTRLSLVNHTPPGYNQWSTPASDSSGDIVDYDLNDISTPASDSSGDIVDYD
jgi:hypothetical protein